MASQDQGAPHTAHSLQVAHVAHVAPDGLWGVVRRGCLWPPTCPLPVRRDGPELCLLPRVFPTESCQCTAKPLG